MSSFWNATSLVLNQLPLLYKDGNDLIITDHLFNGLNQLYPDKSDDDFKMICDDLKLKFELKGVLRTKNNNIL